MTGADVPPLAAEAREAAFAVWYQARVQQAGCDLVTHEAYGAGWAAALQRAARPEAVTAIAVALRKGHARSGVRLPANDRRDLAAELIASLLRGGGGGDGA